MHKIKLSITGNLWLPDNAEIIRFNADDGTKTDCIKLGGRIIQPCIDFLQFHSKEIMLDKLGPNSLCKHGWWISVDEEFQDKNLFPFHQSWYIEEVNNEIDIDDQ